MDQHLKSGMVGCSNLSHMLVTASEFGHCFLLLVAREMPSPLFLGHGRQKREIERERDRERKRELEQASFSRPEWGYERYAARLLSLCPPLRVLVVALILVYNH